MKHSFFKIETMFALWFRCLKEYREGTSALEMPTLRRESRLSSDSSFPERFLERVKPTWWILLREACMSWNPSVDYIVIKKEHESHNEMSFLICEKAFYLHMLGVSQIWIKTGIFIHESRFWLNISLCSDPKAVCSQTPLPTSSVRSVWHCSCAFISLHSLNPPSNPLRQGLVMVHCMCHLGGVMGPSYVVQHYSWYFCEGVCG